MIEQIKNINLINKLFNIKSSEWSKVFATFGVRFLYKAGFVIGWTVIITLFVEQFGVLRLPILFVINAIFTIFGTIVYSAFLHKYSDFKILISALFVSGFLIFVSSFVYSIDKNYFLFLLILIESILLLQFKIVLNAYIEKIFTPLESERIFPITESSETLGAILSGLLIFLLSGIISIPSFMYFWVIFLFLSIPFLIYIQSIIENNEIFKNKHSEHFHISKFLGYLKTEVMDFNKKSFVKGLFMIVFVQWLVFNLVEFQYVNTLYNNVSKVIIDSGSGFENAFIHDLGALFILFNVSAIICQLFLASRLINSLGIIGSMLLHPLLTILSFTLFSFNNGLYPLLFAKNNFMITSVIITNSYHSAFYAIKENLREHIREFLEGIVRPLGALLGTFLILLIQFLSPSGFILFINFSILVVSIILFFVLHKQQKLYFQSAIHDLNNSKDNYIRKNAIEIIAQKGNKDSISRLLNLLNDKNEALSIKIKVLNALGESKDLKSIKFILKNLESDHQSIRVACLDALFNFFRDFKLYNSKYLILRLNIISSLKVLFKNEKSDFIRLKIIKLLTQLSGLSTLEFLIEISNGHNSSLKVEAIRSFGNYKNPELAKLIEPYLKSKKPEFQINAAIALGKLNKNCKIANHKVESFIHSESVSKVCMGIFAIGELKMKNKKRYLLSQLYSGNIQLKQESALALSKMGYFESIPVLVDLLFHEDLKIAKALKLALRNIDFGVLKELDKLLRAIVYEKITDFKIKYPFSTYNELDYKKLYQIRWLYRLAEEYDEVEQIDKILKK